MLNFLFDVPYGEDDSQPCARDIREMHAFRFRGLRGRSIDGILTNGVLLKLRRRLEAETTSGRKTHGIHGGKTYRQQSQDQLQHTGGRF